MKKSTKLFWQDTLVWAMCGSTYVALCYVFWAISEGWF